MAFVKIDNVAIRGIAACVPKNVEENRTLPFYAEGEAEQVIEAIGIERRHVAPQEITASDLCFEAAEKLILELGWDKESIDLLAFVTQCADYSNHPDSFVVHEKLGLPESTICVDFFHGCPGWVVGLSNVASMLSGGSIKRALILDGDTCARLQYAYSREERPLIGDAGSATALEYDPDAKAMYFSIGTKSDEGKALIHHDGGFRHPYTMETLSRELKVRSGESSDLSDLSKMDGMDVFSFAITKIPKAIKKLCAEYNVDLESVDNLFLHQANKMIVGAIAKRLKVPMEGVPTSLKEFGNTTSVSIPLTIVTERASQLKSQNQRNLACGFGTGLAWGVVYFETSRIVVPELILL